MPPKRNPELHKQNARRFIEAARIMLASEAFEDISIRRIAAEAGFHNSTIYSYFRDADWLIALASVGYFKKYSESLAEISLRGQPPYETFFLIWKSFCENAFENPDLFYNFFFGKYSESLTELFQEYYDLYPDEENEFSPNIREMFFGQRLEDRCLSLLKELIDVPDTRVNRDNVSIVNFIVLETFEGFLQNQLHNQHPFGPDQTEEFLKVLHFLIDP